MLGGSNAKLAALEVRILFSKEEYEAAQAKIEEFFSYGPGPNLQRELSSILVRIDGEAERQRERRIAERARAEKSRLENARKAAEAEALREKILHWQKPSEQVSLLWSRAAQASYTIGVAGISVGPDDRITFANLEKYSESRGVVRRGQVKDGCAIYSYSDDGVAIAKRAFRVRHYCYTVAPKNRGVVHLAATYSGDEWELVLLEYGGSGSIARIEDRVIPKVAPQNVFAPSLIAPIGGEFFTGIKAWDSAGRISGGLISVLSDKRADVWNYSAEPVAIVSAPSGGLYYLSVVSAENWQSGQPIKYALDLFDAPVENGINRAWRNEFELESGLDLATFDVGADGLGYAILRTTKGFDREYITAIAKVELGESTDFNSYKPLGLSAFRGEVLRAHPDGGMVIGGSNKESGKRQPMLVRLDADLNIQWIKRINTDERSITHMESLSNGDLAVAGYLSKKKSWVGVVSTSLAP